MTGAVELYGWDSANSEWVKVLVNADGKLIIDPSEIFENPPTDGETAKGAQSDWCYDHWKDPSAHHTKYTDAEAIAAAKTDATLLNYTQGARVYNNADLTTTTGTPFFIPFNSERWDTDNIHDTVTLNGRLTCKTAGKYLIGLNLEFEANATGDRYASIRYNNTTYIATAGFRASSGLTSVVQLATIWDMAVDDFIDCFAYQTSGGNLKIKYLPAYSPEFMMQRIG